MYILYIFTGLAVLISFVADRQKTIKAAKITIKKLRKIFSAFMLMLILTSFILFFLPDQIISSYLGHNNQFLSVIFAASFGSIAVMPGFIVFPLCGVLLGKGVAYMVLSAFSTTLMMVGIVTFPIEKEYFGNKVALIRNIMSFVIALIVAVFTGLLFGELF